MASWIGHSRLLILEFDKEKYTIPTPSRVSLITQKLVLHLGLFKSTVGIVALLNAIFEYHMLPQQIYCFRRRNEEQDLTVLQLFSEQNIPYLFH